MKILNVNMSIDPVTGGGTAERTVKVARYLARSGVESSLLTSDIGVDEKLCNSLSNVRLYIMKNLYSRYYISRFSFKWISEIVAQSDIVHLMNHWTAVNAAVYRACRRHGKPYVVCPAGALLYYGRSILLKKIYNYAIGKDILRNAARHVAIPSEEAHQFADYGIDPRTVVIIPNGIDRDDFSSRNDELFRREHSLGDKPFILFMGRLNSIKGPDLLLDAFVGLSMEAPEYQLVFAGPDGGMLESLAAVARRHNLSDRVHFLGYIGGDEKSWAYHAAELLVIPSRQEAMSIVALEAGISGTPVLLTDVCGFEKVERIGGGLLVSPNADSIQAGLNTLLRDRKGLALKGKLLKDYVSKNYTWDSIISQYISVFNDVLAKA